MKNETSQKENHNEQEGFPIQALLLVGILGLAVLGIVLKMVGLF